MPANPTPREQVRAKARREILDARDAALKHFNAENARLLEMAWDAYDRLLALPAPEATGGERDFEKIAEAVLNISRQHPEPVKGIAHLLRSAFPRAATPPAGAPPKDEDRDPGDGASYFEETVQSALCPVPAAPRTEDRHEIIEEALKAYNRRLLEAAESDLARMSDEFTDREGLAAALELARRFTPSALHAALTVAADRIRNGPPHAEGSLCTDHAAPRNDCSKCMAQFRNSTYTAPVPAAEGSGERGKVDFDAADAIAAVWLEPDGLGESYPDVPELARAYAALRAAPVVERIEYGMRRESDNAVFDMWTKERAEKFTKDSGEGFVAIQRTVTVGPWEPVAAPSAEGGGTRVPMSRKIAGAITRENKLAPPSGPSAEGGSRE